MAELHYGLNLDYKKIAREYDSPVSFVEAVLDRCASGNEVNRISTSSKVVSIASVQVPKKATR